MELNRFHSSFQQLIELVLRQLEAPGGGIDEREDHAALVDVDQAVAGAHDLLQGDERLLVPTELGKRQSHVVGEGDVFRDLTLPGELP